MIYKPMLARLGGKDFVSKKGFLFEPKLDGVRILLYKDKSSIELINKNGYNKTKIFPEIVNTAKLLKPKQCVLDGEIVVYDDGMPSFSAVMKRDHAKSALDSEIRMQQYPATYVVFDILELEGKSLVDLPIEERKELLANAIVETNHLEVSPFTQDGTKLWKQIEKIRLEGIVAKKKESKYYSGERTPEWIKIKNLSTVDVIIVGFTTQKRHISSLCMALYKDGKLTFIGKVGTGFNENMLEEMGIKFNELKTDSEPIVNPPDEKVQWLKPSLVAEVEYLKVTADEQLRSPSFKGFRGDKKPDECTWEDQIGQ